MTDEIGDFYAQTNQFEDDDLATMAEYLSQLDEDDLD